MKAQVVNLALILAAAMTSQAQSIDGCAVNRSAPPAGMYSWAPHAEISVYFVRGMFTDEQRETLVQAMQNWTVAARKVGAGVRFDYAGETAGLVNCRIA